MSVAVNPPVGAPRRISKVGANQALSTPQSGPLTQHHRLTLDEVCEIFKPTGITAPAEVETDSTAQIPEPSELEGRKATDINGEAQYQVIRTWTIPGLKPTYETIIVATADPELGQKEFSEFMRHYSGAPRHLQAEMLGRKDWVELQRLVIASGIARNKANGGQAGGSTYKAKIIMAPTTTSSGTSNTHVLMGTSAAGKKRLTWMGHSGFALARYLGSKGWTGAEAVDTFNKIQLPMGKTAIVGGVYAGKSGTRGEPAKVTPEQHAMLEVHLKAFRASKATAASDKTSKEEASAKTKPAPAAAPIIQSAKPLHFDAHTTEPQAISRPAPKAKAGSKADKEAKLAEAMTAKANQRKANKAAATAKAQATKANKAKA